MDTVVFVTNTYTVLQSTYLQKIVWKLMHVRAFTWGGRKHDRCEWSEAANTLPYFAIVNTIVSAVFAPWCLAVVLLNLTLTVQL